MNRETRVGLFLLALVAGLIPFTLFIGNIKLFQNTDSYFADFADVQALPPKAMVKVAGVEIGKVAEIKLVRGRARIEIAISPDVPVYENASARIGSTGVIGSRFVELIPGGPPAARLEPGAVIDGVEGASIDKMIEKLSKIFEPDPVHGNAVENLQATLANIRQVSEALNGALGRQQKELGQIVRNVRDFTGDLREITGERKEDVKVALKKFRSIAEKLDSILAKVERGEGTIGALVSDEETAQDVKEAISSIKTTAASAKKVLGRFTLINTYWNYRYRYDFRDEESRSDAAITFVPRPGKFYSIGVTNIGEPEDNEKSVAFERRNRITAVMGADYGPFTGYAGAIRSDGGVGLNVRPFWFNPAWNRRVELNFEAADFSRDRVVQGRRLDSAWMALGGRVALTKWLWLGARVEDILERSAFMAQAGIIFRDEDLTYLLGLASVSR